MVSWRDIPGNPDAFEELVELLQSGDAVGFVGAGASAGLYPLWPQLIGELADVAVAAGADPAFKPAWLDMDALQAALQIRQELGEGPFAEKILATFGPKKGPDGKCYTPVHSALARFGFRGFATTNYDPGLRFACQAHTPDLVVQEFDWREDRVTRWLQNRPTAAGELPILHAHGRYDAKDSLVLDAESYRRAYTDSRYLELLGELWIRERLVVVGFSFNDLWLRVFADLAISRSGAREVTDRRHFALIGLPADQIAAAMAYRKAIENSYHLRALFYPVITTTDPDGKKRDDHSALGPLLEELLAAKGGAKPRSTSISAPQPDPLTVWFQQVKEEHRQLPGIFDGPPALKLLEQAWVQVMVQPAVDKRALPDAEHDLLRGPTELDKVLALPTGEPSWNVGRWLLEGPPGSGKTTLLRHLAARLAEAASAECVPVFVSLPRLVESSQDLLHHVTDGLDLAGPQGVRDALAAAGQEGRLVLLLDSYDEVPQERRTVVDRLLGQLSRNAAWSSCKLVVSSRPIGRGDALSGLPRLDLLPLDEGRRREFLENWFRHAGRGDWEDKADRALTYLTGNRWLRDLSGIPLYLTLLASLWQQGVQPSGKLADLYDQIFKLLLNGSHRQNPRRMPCQQEVLAALRHLAYGMTEDERWAKSVEDLEGRLRSSPDLCRQLGTFAAWREDLFAFLRDVYERTQILGPHDGARGDWRFWHRTFREALTAEQLRRQHEEAGPDALVEWARQLEEGGEGRWAEPLALLAGRLAEPDDLVLRLSKANHRLALRAAAFAQDLKPETVVALLQMTNNLDKRAQLFEGIPDQLDDPSACLALVEPLHAGCRNGFDLFWLWWILEEVKRRWPRDHRAADLLDRFFDHIPPPENPELLWTLDSPLDGRVAMWREIPAGEGWVGSPEDEEGRTEHESPQHRVHIESPFWMSAGPVTKAQYELFDPQIVCPTMISPQEAFFFLMPGDPQIFVTWYEAVSFCRWLGTLPAFKNARPRLPREEEWEYACRAGTSTRFWCGDSEAQLGQVAWFKSNAGKRPHRPGEKPANAFGLYDMHGNVWEWTASHWSSLRYSGRTEGSSLSIRPDQDSAELHEFPRRKRVVRGGSFNDSSVWCRSACDDIRNPAVALVDPGFRVLLSSAPSRDSVPAPGRG